MFGRSSGIESVAVPFSLRNDRRPINAAVTLIELETFIAAPVETCFDASRDIALHLASAAATGERVIAGRTAGLCELGDTMTWQARHFGIWQKMTVEICEMHYPTYFVDRMVRGAFKSMRHEHYFDAIGDTTCMRDRFTYQTPFSAFGLVFDLLLLRQHMRQFLLRRNRVLKEYCENHAAIKPA